MPDYITFLKEYTAGFKRRWDDSEDPHFELFLGDYHESLRNFLKDFSRKAKDEHALLSIGLDFLRATYHPCHEKDLIQAFLQFQFDHGVMNGAIPFLVWILSDRKDDTLIDRGVALAKKPFLLLKMVGDYFYPEEGPALNQNFREYRDLAFTFYQRAIILNDQDPDLSFRYARTMPLTLNTFQENVHAYEHALTLAPANCDILSDLASLYSHQAFETKDHSYFVQCISFIKDAIVCDQKNEGYKRELFSCRWVHFGQFLKEQHALGICQIPFSKLNDLLLFTSEKELLSFFEQMPLEQVYLQYPYRFQIDQHNKVVIFSLQQPGESDPQEEESEKYAIFDHFLHLCKCALAADKNYFSLERLCDEFELASIKEFYDLFAFWRQKQLFKDAPFRFSLDRERERLTFSPKEQKKV